MSVSTEYSLPVELLARRFFQGHISKEEYRQQRKTIIDQMEQEYNNVKCQTESDDLENPEEDV